MIARRQSRKRRATAGVTLMELLIAISLLSLLTVGVMMSLRVGLGAMERSNDHLLSNRRVAGAQRVLEQQIAGLMITTTECGMEGGPKVGNVPFFQGEPQTMRFVSSFSMHQAHRGYPQILEYQVIPGERGEGVRLVVNERLYAGPISSGPLCIGPGPGGQTLFQPVAIGAQSFVLADRLAMCRFAYLAQGPTPDMKEWVPVWIERTFPLAIRVDFRPLEQDPSKLPLLSLTMPVRVNRLPELDYAD